MSGSDDSAEKSHAPTQRKLEEARRKGEVARSADLGATAAWAGLWLALAAAGPAGVIALGTSLRSLMAEPDQWRVAFFDGPADGPVAGLMMAVAAPVAPWLLVPLAALLAAVTAQQALIFAPDRLRPRLSRISPLAIARQRFGAGGLFEFAKSLAKLLILGAVLAVFLAANLDRMAATVAASPAGAMAVLGQISLELLALMVLVMAVIGAVDFLWQRHEHLRKNRMTHKDMRDEMKESEGDPQMRQTRRERARAIAGQRMMQDVPGADVVVVNPTHYAVALKWSRAPGAAPVCVAKGVDEIAGRIREIAAENGVPIHSDPPTARALHASTEIGQEIAPAQYRAVAAAIRFSDRIRARAVRR